mmetsp:Transcript_60022/g.123245  ORF Transcript_60022/g.123245 Transcript_60022/m.123245 type:complete len:503 (-) Transcript_60022:259-1767(-)
MDLNLEGHVSVLAPGSVHLLVLQQLQVLAQSLPGGGGVNDVVHKSALSRHHGIRESVGVLDSLLLDVFAAENDLHCTLGTHHRHLCTRPCVVVVALEVLGGHDIVGATVCLARDHSELGHGSLRVCVKQFGAVADDSPVLLNSPRQEPGNVHEGDDGDVEGVQESHEAGGLHRGVDVQAAGQVPRVVANHPDGAPLHTRKPTDDVLGVVRHDLRDHSFVHHLLHHLQHVVGGVGVIGNEVAQRVLLSVPRIERGLGSRFILVVQREIIEDLSQALQSHHVVVKGCVGDSREGGVRISAAQLLLRNIFLRDGLDHVGARHEHVRGVFHHEDEIGHSGGVHCPASTGTHDHAQLGNHARSLHVLVEHVRVSSQRVHAFLDARTTRVVEADDRRAHTHSHVHHLADLLSMGLAEGAAEDSEVLAEHEHFAAIDKTMSSDHAVAVELLVLHAELIAAVGLEHVVLSEGVLVQQEGDTLAGGELALFVLGVDALLATAHQGTLTGRL